jgi:hypothetical protein
MKIRISLLAAIFAMLSISKAQAQLTQVYNEVYAVDGVTGYTTYRIFADLDNPEDFLSSIAATEGAPLMLGGSGNTIWNSEAGAAIGDILSTGFCNFIPDLCFDSFVTIGWYGADDFNGDPMGCGQATTTISSIPNPTVIIDSFGADSEAPNLVMQDGSWYTHNLAGCNANGFGIGPTNKILIAQVTIPSTDNLVYNLNIQIFLNAVGSDAAYYVHDPSGLGIDQYDGSELGLIYPVGNCLDLTACNYDSWPGQDEDQTTCDFSCYGCMDSCYCNYDPAIIYDDGSCTSTCAGCMDTAARNYEDNATEQDGSCEYTGCMDSEAANYDLIANIDDNSCEYPGCMVGYAVNYDNGANVDDGSCLFKIEGYVFYDGNQTGMFEDVDFEYGIDFQKVTLEPIGLVVITDENGYYSFGNHPSGEYTLKIAENTTFPINTTPAPYTISAINLEYGGVFYLGLTDDEVYYSIEVDIHPSGGGYQCNGEFSYHRTYFRNLGSEPISGIVKIDYDALFEGYYELTQIDSVVGNSIYMSYEDLLPGQSHYYKVYLITPEFATMGEYLTTTSYVYSMDGDEVIIVAEDSTKREVTCAYDPNDKMVLPPEYDEPH